jgi:hypothetical protein
VVIEEIAEDWVVVSGTSFAAPIALGYGGSLMTAHPQVFAAAEPDLQEHFEKSICGHGPRRDRHE